jgi:hypothetical protein
LGGGSGESGGNDSDNSLDEIGAQGDQSLKRSINSNVLPYKPKDEVALRRSQRDLSSHRSSIAGKYIIE